MAPPIQSPAPGIKPKTGSIPTRIFVLGIVNLLSSSSANFSGLDFLSGINLYKRFIVTIALWLFTQSCTKNAQKITKFFCNQAILHHLCNKKQIKHDPLKVIGKNAMRILWFSLPAFVRCDRGTFSVCAGFLVSPQAARRYR